MEHTLIGMKHYWSKIIVPRLTQVQKLLIVDDRILPADDRLCPVALKNFFMLLIYLNSEGQIQEIAPYIHDLWSGYTFLTSSIPLSENDILYEKDAPSEISCDYHEGIKWLLGDDGKSYTGDISFNQETSFAPDGNSPKAKQWNEFLRPYTEFTTNQLHFEHRLIRGDLCCIFDCIKSLYPEMVMKHMPDYDENALWQRTRTISVNQVIISLAKERGFVKRLAHILYKNWQMTVFDLGVHDPRSEIAFWSLSEFHYKKIISGLRIDLAAIALFLDDRLQRQ